MTKGPNVNKPKIRPWTFKFIESELTYYHDSLKELEQLKNDIIYGTGSSDENVGGGRSNIPQSTTERKGIALSESREIQQLQRITSAIQSVTDRLPPEKKKLVQLKYWAKPQTLTWDGIAYELNVSRMTVLRWRQEIVYAIIQITGMR